VTSYNYENFDEYVESGEDEKEFSTFFDRLHAGEPAPVAILTDLTDDSAVHLSELWVDSNLVIEFGSYT
jgi:hypothetical protein